MSRPGIHQSVLGNRGDHRNVVFVLMRRCANVRTYPIHAEPSLRFHKSKPTTNDAPSHNDNGKVTVPDLLVTS
jgi:hypothetical protein